MPFKHTVRTKKTPSFKKPLFLSLAALLLIAGVIGALEITGVINVFKKSNPGLATQPTTPNRTAGIGTKGNQQQATQPAAASNESDTKLSPGDTTAANLKAPTDSNFVSNHHPSLTGQPGPDMQSSCVTTTGATCTITFTKGSETKQLPVQNTDREGAAYWSWKLQNIGLTAGTWKIQAKAVLGSQVKTADDALTLEVSP